MADFRKALEFVLPHEGGYSNDPDDPGGETNFGITVAKAREYGYTGEMRDMDLDTAAEIYSIEYWNGLDEVNSQAVASKILDMRINFGVSGGNRIAQTAVNALVDPPVSVDGTWGPDTLDAINTADPVKLVRALAESSADHYKSIAANRPKSQKFLAGWLKRAADVPAMAATGGIILILALAAGVYFMIGRSKA